MTQQTPQQDLQWGNLLAGGNQHLAAALLLATNQRPSEPLDEYQSSPIQETALNLSLSAGAPSSNLGHQSSLAPAPSSPQETSADQHQHHSNHSNQNNQNNNHNIHIHDNSINHQHTTASLPTGEQTPLTTGCHASENHLDSGANQSLEAQLLALQSNQQNSGQQMRALARDKYIARLISAGGYLWPSAGASSSLASSGSSSSSSSTGSWSPERATSISSPTEMADIYFAHQQHQALHNQLGAHKDTQQHCRSHLVDDTTQKQHEHQPAQRPLFMSSQNYELRGGHRTDSDDLDKIRDFIEQFKSRRGALGLTQKQAAQCFRAYTRDRYAFSDNFVGHFEGFQFRPQTAMTIADSLSEWLEFAEEETRMNRQLTFMAGKVKETRKRKYEVIRIRDSAKRVLVEAFEKNKSPSSSELEMLSRRTNIPSRNIEIFFKNRRTSRQYHQ